MYTRTVNGKEIELHVSGKLYKDALVMFDRETGTLWTQVDGSALRGPLAGQRLAKVPAMQTTWKVWKKLYPDTLVLAKPAAIRRSSYSDYFADPDRRGLFGTRGDPRLPGKTIIIGVRTENEAVAVLLSALEKRLLVEVALAGEPIVVFYSQEDQTVSVFRAKVRGRRLSFRISKQGKQTLSEDLETRSLWSPLDGRALAGPLKDTRLEPVAYLRSYWFAWSAYQPKTRIVPTP